MLRKIGMVKFAGSAQPFSKLPARAASGDRIKPQALRGRRARAVALSSLASLGLLMGSSAVDARSGYLTRWSLQYPASTSETQAGRGGCQLCHGAANNRVNPYGLAIRSHLGGATNVSNAIMDAAIAAEAPNDADGQGDSNNVEIAANTQPGWTTLTPIYVTSSGAFDSNIDPTTIGVQLPLDPTVISGPPTADAGGPYSGTAGVAVTFDGSGSSDVGAGTIVSYAWDFGDGVGTGTGVNPTYAYAASGTYTVTLTVTDNDGLTDTATSTATIVSAPQDPIAIPGGPYTGTVGVAVNFNGTASNDPDGGAIAQYDWDFGDGTLGTGATPSHAYIAAGIYTVTLTVVDNEGVTSAPATTTATISSIPTNDADGDGVPDSQDNCINKANGPTIPDAGGNSQRDTDSDGYGNICDPDFNGNKIVDPTDFSLLKSRLGSTTEPDLDLNGNGIVDPIDFSITKSALGKPPGPSCVTLPGGCQ
jgi:PKD repeat protein